MSGYDVPVNLQQDKCYSRFCNFLHLYEWKVLHLERSENGLSCIFQAIGSILNLKQKQSNAKVKVKETDLIWSKICSSLFQSGVRMISVERQWGQQLGKKGANSAPSSIRAKRGRLASATSTYYVILFARNFKRKI